MNEPRYRTNFAWDSPYGHVVNLVKKLRITPGWVIDLGCGWGQVAEPLSEMGFKYFGLDTADEVITDLRNRGFDGMQLDLRQESLAEDLADKFSGRRVALVLMIDALEHIPDTGAFLRSLQAAMLALDRPALILSVPNVGHVDLGAKLALGRFDYTPAGLLDETHASLFTERRLSKEMGTGGWVEVAADDFYMSQSDQHFPDDHPALVYGTPLASFISSLRNQADPYAHVNNFVRAYFLHLVEPKAPAPQSPPPFLSVLMRTTGQRPDTLAEALTCLAAQTVDDFEVKLMVHTNGTVDGAVAALVNRFHSTFSSRVEVIPVRGGGRSRPLNAGLDRATGEYVAFLDDDDMVTGNWVERFKQGARTSPGRIIRSITLSQNVEMSEDPRLSYRVRSGLMQTFQPDFDLASHLFRNQTPICSFAVPRAAVETLNLRFDESLPVTEDWEFLLRAAQIAGVSDTGAVTSVYRRWLAGEGSDALVEGSVWDAVRKSILHRLDQEPILLPPGSASRVAEHAANSSRITDMTREVMDQRAEIDRLGILLQHAEACGAHHLRQAQNLEERLLRAERDKEAVENSLSMRVTRPIRLALHYLRRLPRSP